MFFFYFRYKLYDCLQKIPCELPEFSLSTRHLFFLGSCLSQFFKNLVRAHATCQQLLQHSLCFGLLSFFSFRSAFEVSMLAVMDAISIFRDAIASCFSAIWVAKSLVTLVLGRFLLPFVLGIDDNRFPFWFKYYSVFE